MGLEHGIAERDAGLARVMSSHSRWVTAALWTARGVRVGWTGMGEDLRALLVDYGLREPNHHNAWGALINAMVLQGILRPTGEIGQMKKVSSHARQSTVYEKVK